MIGLALSGGGSRAMAFHLGCLRAMNDLRLLERVGVISTISGGSIIGAYYAYTPDKPFSEFEEDIRRFLRKGFHRAIGRELMNPLKLLYGLSSFTKSRFAEAVAIFTGNAPRFVRTFSRTDLLRHVLDRDVYRGLALTAPRRHGMEVVIGACELRHGTAFRFGNRVSGDWRRGTLISNDVDLSFAVAASAAYPILLPVLDRTWNFVKDNVEKEHRVCLTDGGVYDNLGIQVLEPGRDPTVSLHCFPCEYLVVCNAGHGQHSGDKIPLGSYRRVSQAFRTIHRRVQDSAMNRLHHLMVSGAIKGFALPYLGQMDERLPWKPAELVPRSAVVGYPTDFAAMTDEWTDRLSARGEQLTRCLLSQYLPELL